MPNDTVHPETIEVNGRTYAWPKQPVVIVPLEAPKSILQNMYILFVAE